jgi:Protein of unknown function (DUF1612)/HTH DNA binding domain
MSRKTISYTGESANIPVLFDPALFVPALLATAALTRLDERLCNSPVREGYIARMAFHEAVASMWLGGELVHLEDLVLHDAHMDIRAPTHELTLAHQVLRAIRQVAANTPDWTLSHNGLQSLRGQRQDTPINSHDLGEADDGSNDRSVGNGISMASLELDRDLADMDARLQRLDAMLQRTASRAVAGDTGYSVEEYQISGGVSPASGLTPLIYDEDDYAEERLADWRNRVTATQTLPPVLRAALALEDWNHNDVLLRTPWLGSLLAVSMLRAENKLAGKASGHGTLPAIFMGLRQIPREQRNAKDQTDRLAALLDAFEHSALIGLKHDRLVLARTQLDRKLKGKRANSKLPALIDLVLARPLVTSTMIERELKVTLQGALNLVAELGLREVTGRVRYRAWGVM